MAGPKRNSEYLKKPQADKKTAVTSRSSSSQKKSAKKESDSLGKIVRKNTHSEKNSKFSTHGKAAFIFIVSLFFIIVVVFSAFLSYTYLVDKYENPIIIEELDINEYNQVEFKILKGETSTQIAERLKQLGLIKNKFIYKLMSKFNGYDGEYKSGVHYLREDLTIDEIMTVLSADPVTVKVTFPEGFTTIQIAERLEANDICRKEEFLSALNELDYSSYLFIPEKNELRDYVVDGYLFPDTYIFGIHSDVETIVYKMLNRFNDIFLPEYYERIEKNEMSIDEVVTIASYVEKEAKITSERETIARVYYNRMKSQDFDFMQCDATVLYAMKRNGITDTVISNEYLQLDDPYNTYVSEGLSPGAICSPSEASIKAVITMNPHDYYYYVLKKDGNGAHVFSKTLEEHKKAVAENK